MSKDTTQSSNFQQDTEINLNSPTFERYIHNRENPYVMLSRELVRNPNLSFQARGFLSYLLSHKDDWKIRRDYIIKTQNIGKYRLKSIIDELIREKYMHMEKSQNSIGQWVVKYLVSEFPIDFKKISTNAENPHAEIPHAENPPYKERIIEKEITKEKNTPISPKRGLRSLRYEKRKEWAYANQNNSPCGSSVALEDRYVIHSGGAPPEIHWYAKRDPFWDKLNL